MNILVCEDDAAIQKLIEFKLKKELKANVQTVSNGRDALKALAGNHTFDLIITDIHMPYHSGLELLEHLRGNEDKTPVIVLSAEGLEDTLEEAFDLGAEEFITKPFSPQELIARVKKVIR